MSNLEGHRSAKSVWLLSFGDLLTLLVAYFVLAVALKIKEIQVISHENIQSFKNGTEIASKDYIDRGTLDKGMTVLNISKEIVLFENQILSGSIPAIDINNEDHIEIEVCAYANLSAGEIARRIIREVKDSKSFREIELLASCNDLTYYLPVTAKVVAVVRVRSR